MTAGPAIEMWSGQEADASSDDGRRRVYNRTRAFTVTLDADDELEVVYTAAGLPLVGYSLPGAPLVICRRLLPTRISPILAMVRAQYSGEVGPSGIEGTTPIDNPIQIQWSDAVTDEPIDEDIYGNPIVTVNNEPIDGITERVPDVVAVVSRSFLTFNAYLFQQYLRSVNSDTFLEWPAGTCRFMGFNATQVFGSNQSTGMWNVTGTFQFRYPFNTTAERAWWKRVRHEGFQVRETAGGDIFHGSDSAGELLSRPVLLKADGTVETDPEAAYFQEFETVFPLPYSVLGFA